MVLLHTGLLIFKVLPMLIEYRILNFTLNYINFGVIYVQMVRFSNSGLLTVQKISAPLSNMSCIGPPNHMIRPFENGIKSV